MTSASWSHSGRILLNASRVYYLPDEPSLPPLRWMPEKQRFEYFSSTNSEDVELRASLVELAQACSQLYHLQSVQQQSIAASLSCYLPCEAIYGVLPLGSVNSALIYVTAKEYVCSLAVGGGTHDIYAVRGMQWLNLPCVTSSSAHSQRQQQRQQRPRSHHGGRRCDTGGAAREGSGGSEGDDDNDGAADEGETGGRAQKGGGASRRRGTSEDNEGEMPEEEENSTTETDGAEDDDNDDDSSEEVGRLPNKTVDDYLAVLHRFCESVNTQDGGQDAAAHRAAKLPGIACPAGKFSYFYFSPTMDLSADPLYLLGLITHTPHPSMALLRPTVRGDVDDNSLSTATTNHEGFGSDTNPDLTETHKTSRHGSNAAGSHHAWEDFRAAATTRQLYQWNGPLLAEGFALPTMAALRGELYASHHSGRSASDASAVSGGEDGEGGDDSLVLPWHGVCVEEVQRDARARQHHAQNHVSASAAAAAAVMPPASPQSPSSVSLYVPLFIRGLVAQAEASPTLAMTLVTRTCCRWAGTRYNRRGLEPGHSGVVANMSLTSLWVTPRANMSRGDAASAADAATPEKRAKQSSRSRSSSSSSDNGSGRTDTATPFAVYTVMRGSVPRRWEQPANLALKPTIKISPIGNAAEELGRHVRLLKQCLPHMHALFCLDTMSQSKLEEPLAEAFAAAVKRYVEGTSKAASLTTSLVLDGKDAVRVAGDDSHAAAAGNNTNNHNGALERDPFVMLVKFNVKKELKTHHYDEMMRRCLAELDSAAGNDAWLDFTKGYARCPREGEAEVVEQGRIGGAAAEGSSLSGSLSNTLPGTRDAVATQDEGLHAAAAAISPRLCFDHVQSRLVRVNCLDCLDRTNLVQSILFCAALPRMMAYVDGASCSAGSEAAERSSSSKTSSCVDLALRHPDFATASHRLRVLMAAQGTAISQLYAGTEPHFVPYMLNGHHHWFHTAVEGVLAERRWYQQNFFDGVKQDGISLITRQHNPQVFNADIESPFSRDLSGMNRQVMYGVLLSVFPFLYSLVMCFSEPHYASSVFQLHFAICLCWVVYFSVLYNKLMRYRVTYTNRPLLLYTRQVEWC